jgi:hypothetical protein
VRPVAGLGHSLQFEGTGERAWRLGITAHIGKTLDVVKLVLMHADGRERVEARSHKQMMSEKGIG